MPIFEILVAVAGLLAYIKFTPSLRSFGARLPASQASDGISIWCTRDGAVYEDVGTFFVRGDAVTFRHKYGTVRLNIAELTSESRGLLIRRYQENHSLGVLPREDDLREVRVCEIEAA